MKRLSISKTQLEEVISQSVSMASAAKRLGISSSSFRRYAKKYGLYFPNQGGKGIPAENKYTSEIIFCKNSVVSQRTLRLRMISENIKDHTTCEICKKQMWMNKKITMELDHINGKHNDNRIENLRYLCPNCHSQTPTFKKRDISKIYVTDESLLKALKNNKNISCALKFVGLTARGGNYKRCYNLMSNYASNV